MTEDDTLYRECADAGAVRQAQKQPISMGYDWVGRWISQPANLSDHFLVTRGFCSGGQQASACARWLASVRFLIMNQLTRQSKRFPATTALDEVRDQAAESVLWNERRCPGSRPRRLSISSPASIAPLHGSLVRDGLGKSYGHAEHSPYDLQIDAPYLLHILSAHGALGKDVNGSTTHAHTAVTAR